MDYRGAGVDVKKGDALVDWLQDSHKRDSYELSGASEFSAELESKSNLILDGIGGFASIAKIPNQFKSPCLVTCTDGVGTKVKIASEFNRFEEVAQDMVAMCVNDLICTGADPFLFLDYYATGKLNLEQAKSFLLGVKKACSEALCILVGGETAEMPGVYQKNDFDCAGFAVGIVDEEERWGPHRVQCGDSLIGIESSGFHSNGFSLLRKIYQDDLSQNLDLLLKPTRLYCKLFKHLKNRGLIPHAAAHITGGGLSNIPRVLPESLFAEMYAWEIPEPFLEVQKRANLELSELLETLNCGLGMVLVVDSKRANEFIQAIQNFQLKAWKLGEVKMKADTQNYHIAGDRYRIIKRDAVGSF